MSLGIAEGRFGRLGDDSPVSPDFDFYQNQLERHIGRLFKHGKNPVERREKGYEWSYKWLLAEHLPSVYVDYEAEQRDSAIVESLVNIIASPRTSQSAREQALINLQCAPISQEVACQAVSHIADRIAELHTRSAQSVDDASDALKLAFYTVARESNPDVTDGLIDHQMQVIRDTYLSARSEASRLAIQDLGKVIEITDETGESSTSRRYDVADFVDQVDHDGQLRKLAQHAQIGRMATSTIVAASILTGPTVAAADSPRHDGSLSGAGLASGTVISRVFSDLTPETKEVAAGQVAGQSTGEDRPTPAQAEAMVDGMFSDKDHPFAAQVAAVMATPRANGAKVVDKLINPKADTGVIKVVAQTPKDRTGLNPDQVYQRGTLEQLGYIDESGQPGFERGASGVERKLRKEVGDELDRLVDMVAVAVEERRIGGAMAEHVRGTLIPLLRESLEGGSRLSLLTPDERFAYALDDRLGSRELVNQVIEDMSEDDPVLKWARQLETTDDEEDLNDGLVALMIYSGIEAAVMTKAEANATVGFKYAEVPEFVNTKIEQAKLSGIDKVGIANYTELSDGVRFDNLVRTMDELNQQALNDRRNGASFGGWDGDIRELAQIYWDTAKRHNSPLVTAEILMAQGYQESRFDSSATSPAGAMGIAQFMPGTVDDYSSWMGSHVARYPNGFDPRDPVQAIDAQAIYMMWTSQFAKGDTLQSLLNQTLAGYNAGVGNLQRLGDTLVSEGLYINGSLVTSEPAKYQKGINSYLQLAFSNAEKLANSQQSQATEQEKQIEKLKEAGFTEYTENMANDPPEMAPMNIDRGNKWQQYINQNAEGIKRRLEDAGLDPNLGSLHMCGLVTIEMIAVSERGDIATDEESMNRVYDQLIDTYIWARNHDVFTDPNGGAMWHAKMVDLADHLGLDVQTLPELSYPEIVRAFNNGVPYITINTNPQKLDANSPFKSGHIYAIDGVTEDGRLTIIDPASYERTQKAYDPDKLLPYADPTAVHAMSTPGKMDSYIDAIAADKAEAERKAKEKAEEEAAKKAAKEKAAKEAAEQEERERHERSERRSQLDPSAKVDGWAIRQQLEARFPVSGTLPADMLVVPVPGLYEQMGDREEVRFTPEAAAGFKAMNEAYKAHFGENIVVNDAYRSYDSQVATKAEWTAMGRPNMAANPGESPHGYGGVDINVGAFGSAKYNWFVENGPKFGWYNPVWMDPNSAINPAISDVLGFIPAKKAEPWHFEFYGNSDEIDVLVGGHSYYDMKTLNKIRGKR